MQHRYVGDIGDYVKLAILRALSPGRRLGVAWWLFPDENHNRNGMHLEYLDRPKEWRHYDPTLFDVLCLIRREGKRNIRLLEPLLPNAVFVVERIPSDIQPIADRPAARRAWFRRVVDQLDGTDLVFLDPDNGIAPQSLSLTRQESGKSVLLEEIDILARNGQSLVIYHHQTRMVGGHSHELACLAQRLADGTKARVSGALRARPWSPRAFFILNGDAKLIENAKRIAEIWGCHITWHPRPSA